MYFTSLRCTPFYTHTHTYHTLMLGRQEGRQYSQCIDIYSDTVRPHIVILMPMFSRYATKKILNGDKDNLGIYIYEANKHHLQHFRLFFPSFSIILSLSIHLLVVSNAIIGDGEIMTRTSLICGNRTFAVDTYKIYLFFSFSVVVGIIIMPRLTFLITKLIKYLIQRSIWRSFWLAMKN